jgi:hypothetical protein
MGGAMRRQGLHLGPNGLRALRNWATKEVVPRLGSKAKNEWGRRTQMHMLPQVRTTERRPNKIYMRNRRNMNLKPRKQELRKIQSKLERQHLPALYAALRLFES